jgi:hypothetical protein
MRNRATRSRRVRHASLVSTDRDRIEIGRRDQGIWCPQRDSNSQSRPPQDRGFADFAYGDMGDHLGFEPRPGRLRARRSAIKLVIHGECRRARTSCNGVKSPVPGRSRLAMLGIHVGCGGKPRRFERRPHDGDSFELVHQSGIEPASFGYRPKALPLSYRCIVVRPRGIEPRAFSMS